ncbi:hypothetical protein BKA70DRAFT_1418774 [Coprinopsis sp. MPI-PUGE-AT-0042]|nr:hypothetical protein BKA70DRAFT_1418774 [Coprinopsis sp. MPI-PUGE-AT-0042]
MFAGYSPLFTAGLLSANHHHQPTASTSNLDDIHSLGPRRGSLPDTRCPISPVQDESAAFYFTMQPRRDEQEFRSFLSLDLAESQSLRSASLKRKASSKVSRNWTITRIAENPKVKARAPSPVPTPIHLRFSRDSFRSIPSPKPAPSMDLPELPKASETPAPRLPSIPRSPTLALSFSSPKKSFLSSFRISRSKAPKTVVPLNRSSVITTSTVSTTVRRANRSDALARLEGRNGAPVPRRSTGKNFMSMSDDESSEDESDSDIDSLAPKSDSFDLTDDLFYAAFFEQEDLVLPSAISLPSSPIPDSPISSVRRNSTSPVKPTFRRRPTLVSRRSTKDWLPPLKSFMDLKNDEEQYQQAPSGWTWRSFIDVGGMA